MIPMRLNCFGNKIGMHKNGNKTKNNVANTITP
jgi:hypothetical protein